MSEKLDGIRVFWNGNALISRHGFQIKCPEWFIEKLPKETSLDGELWLGQGNYELVNAIFNSKEYTQWINMTFMVFDLPNSKEYYESRMRDLFNLKLPDHVHVVEVERCSGSGHLRECLEHIVGIGGEGVMANQSRSLYVASRLETLLKVKVCYQ